MATSKVFQLISKIQSDLKGLSFARLFFQVLLCLHLVASADAVSFQKRSDLDFTQLVEALKQEPFWRRKAIWASIREERKIPVSVIRDHQWNFKGGGIVLAPQKFCVQKAKEFERLSALPEYFPEVKFDPATSILHLKVHFLGKLRPLDLALFEENRDNQERIYFRSMGDWLKGLEGVIFFKDLERQSTEVGLIAFYSGQIAWVPNWLFSLSSEAVMHHVAEQLRKSLEHDYKNGTKVD